MLHNNKFVISTAKTAQEVESLRHSWERMNPGPETSIDYYLTIVKSRRRVIRPHVILLSQDGLPVSMLIGRIERKQLKFKIGGKVIFQFAVRSLTVIIGGLLGDTSYESCNILFSELLTSLKQNEADLISFDEIPTDSQIYKLARSIPNFLCVDYFPERSFHFKMTLPASMEDFFKNRKPKSRTKLRSLRKKLNKKHSNNVRSIIVHEKEQIEKFCSDAEVISRKTFQYAYGEGFINNDETRSFLFSAAERGLLRSYILYVNDNPCAFWAGFIYQDTYYGIPVGGTGYDPAFREYQVGTILMLEMIEDLCRDPRVYYMDFGYTDMSYKRRFCDQNWEEANFYIFQPTLKGICLNAIRVLSSLFYRFGNMILRRLNSKDKWEKSKRASFQQKKDKQPSVMSRC